MGEDAPLFSVALPRRHRGRVRTGLEVDVTAARDADVTLSAAGVASLRTLADAIDALDHQLRVAAKPYDRVPLAGLVSQFGETYDRVFAAVSHDADPLTRALAEFTAAETRDPEGSRVD